ncbi:MAG: GNAT family N-acetyltransferase [Acidimicrobiia bacterium]|nr:GNAT family N-acetyltransferase [Acidimicrobiia bacterium]
MTDWSVLDGLEALAPHTGPFPRPGFLRAWWRHRPQGELIVRRSGGGGLVVVHDQGVVRLAGEADLTDYHSPLGPEPAMAAGEIAALLGRGFRVEFDSLPIEAAGPLQHAFGLAGVALAKRQHDAAMVLDLPRDPEAYLAALDGKQRHEVRRKHRRFAEEAGTPVLHRDPDAVGRFAAMHRTAGGDKGVFMTGEMEGFFTSLVADAGAVIDVLLDGVGNAVGAAFGFEDADTYYLYNSAFDQTRSALSPGIVLVTSLIEAAIVSGRRRFDFLKGSEEYKGRLGALPRPLFLLEGST